MATSTVTKVRQGAVGRPLTPAPRGSDHERRRALPSSGVVDSIDLGNTWRTSAGGYSATIHVISRCWQGACTASPYIESNRGSTKQDNLENLPEG